MHKRRKKPRYVDAQMVQVTTVRSKPVDFIINEGDVHWPLPITSIGEKEILEVMHQELFVETLQRSMQTVHDLCPRPRRRRLSPLASRLSPLASLASRLSPLASRLAPRASRLSPLASPPERRVE